MTLVKRLPKNVLGRDFVIGDIHGRFQLVDQALLAVDFDRERDRLFSVGDLVDRGPEPLRALEFLAQPWFHAVRGNHEDMFLHLYRRGTPPEMTVVRGVMDNGMS